MNARDKREINEKIKVLEKVEVILRYRMLDLEEDTKLERELNPAFFLAVDVEASAISIPLGILNQKITALSNHINIYKNLPEDEAAAEITKYEKAALQLGYNIENLQKSIEYCCIINMGEGNYINFPAREVAEWEIWFSRLGKFYKINKDFPLPYSYVTEERALADWITDQKKMIYKNSLPLKFKARLYSMDENFFRPEQEKNKKIFKEHFPKISDIFDKVSSPLEAVKVILKDSPYKYIDCGMVRDLADEKAESFVGGCFFNNPTEQYLSPEKSEYYRKYNSYEEYREELELLQKPFWLSNGSNEIDAENSINAYMSHALKNLSLPFYRIKKVYRYPSLVQNIDEALFYYAKDRWAKLTNCFVGSVQDAVALLENPLSDENDINVIVEFTLSWWNLNDKSIKKVANVSSQRLSLTHI